MKFYRLLLCSLGICLLSSTVRGQILVTPEVTPEDALAVLLGSSGIVPVPGSVTFSGAANQLGTFEQNGSDIAFSSGLILGSGNVAFATNNGQGGNGQNGGDLGGGDGNASDPDLEIVATDSSPTGDPIEINDAAILEFDFESPSDSLEFRYVFASEEYPGFVCGTVNDAFGFFLSGSGLDGGNLFENNAINVAVLPGVDPETFVSINTVNDGTTNCPGNTEFYAGNNPQGGGPNSIEYDGYTVVLTARAQVECGETYHIKMAIGDGGDEILDSAVFLEAGSFQSTGAAFSFGAPIAGGDIGDNDIIYEGGCNDGVVTLNISGCNFATLDTIYPFMTGTAQLGEGLDYFFEIPGQMGPQYTLDTLVLDTDGFIEVTVKVPDDALIEELETITFNFPIPDPDNPGVNQDTLVGSLFISDYVNPSLTLEDSVYVCTGIPLDINLIVNDGEAPYQYDWSDDQLTSDMNTITTPVGTTTYFVTVTDVCQESTMDSIIVGIPPTFTPQTAGELLCPDEESIPLFEGGEPPYNYIFTPDAEFDIMSNLGVISSVVGGEYMLTIADDCGTELDYNITVANYAEISAVAPTNPGGFAIYGDSILIEGCNTGMFDIVVSECLTTLNSNILPYNLTGTATQTEDYSGFPAQIELPDDFTTTIDVTTVQDLLDEGEESVTLNIQYQNPVTAQQETLSATLYIQDYRPIEVSLPADEMICADIDFVPELSIANGALPYSYLWSPEDLVANPTTSSITFPSQDVTYSVTVTDICDNSASDDQFVFLPEELLLRDTISYCIGTLSEPVITGGMLPYDYSQLNPLFEIVNAENGAFEAFEEFGCGFNYIIEDNCGVSPTITEVYPSFNCTTQFFNVFTPDDDTNCDQTLAFDLPCDGSSAPKGCNNVFFIAGNRLFPGSNLHVYNRWGALVWESEDALGYQNDWDGTNKAGDDLVEGVYFYVYDRSDGEGFRGNVSILR